MMDFLVQTLVEIAAIAQAGELVGDGEIQRLLIQTRIFDGAGRKVGKGIQNFQFIQQEVIAVLAVEVNHAQPAGVAGERHADE